jgi:hypothetical protein
MTLSSAAAASLACWIAAQAPAMTFTTIARGESSRIEESREAVARTAAEWSALWKAHGGKPPAVDFSRAMVVAVFLGSRPTAGHAVEITRIEKRDADLVVTYRERRPAADEMAAQMLTAPFHVVRTETHAGRVRFERQR